MSDTKNNYFNLITLFALCLTLGLAGCKEKEAEKAKQAAAAPTPMKVLKVETKDMPYWGEYVGQLSAVETVDVRARVAGFLQEMKFREGSKVKKGDLLFVIDPRPFQEDLKQAQSQMQYNQALLAKAKKDFERFGKLLEEQVVSRDEFESYQTQYNTYLAKVRENKAQVENARIQLGYTKIYSPIDGIIGRLKVDIGNLVGQGENTLLAIVSSVDPVYATFNISESDYMRAKRDPAISEDRENQIKMILADGKEYEHLGKFSMLDRAVNSATGTLGIRVSFPNPEGLLRPGQYAKVRVLIDMIKDAVVVPSRAILDVQGMRSVYVVGDDGKVKSAPIKPGLEIDNLTIVKAGLEKDDLIIADGIRRVRPGMLVKPIVETDKASGQQQPEAPAQQESETKDK